MSRKDRRHDPETAERVTSIIEAAEQAAAALIDKADANAKRYLAEAEAEADRAAATRLQALLETADALQAQADAVRREAARLLESLRHAEFGPRGGSAEPAPPSPAPADQPSPAAPSLQAEAALGGEVSSSRGKHLSAVPGPAPVTGPSAWSAVASGPGADAGPGADPGPGDGEGDGAHPRPGREPEPDPGVAAVPELRNGSDVAAGARLLATQMAVSGYSRREIAAKLSQGFRVEDPTPILDAILGPED